MSTEDRRLTIKVFLTTVSLLVTVWSCAYGYTWVRLGTVETKTEKVHMEHTDSMAQLSQIQTDISWIKNSLDK